MDARRLSGFGRALVGGALGVLTASCGGPTAMSGFSDREARATVVVEPAERCAIQSGRLVIETESVLIREYPHHRSERSRLEEPLIVTVLSRPGTRDAAAEVTAFAAPAAYAAGERIDRLEGEVLLRRLLRSLVGRHLVIRLAENDRTASPSWVRRGKAAAQAGGAATLAGLPSPTGLATQGVELLARLDRDDLMLLADLDLDELARAVSGPGQASASDTPLAARVRLATARHSPPAAGTPGAPLPSAELVLVVWREAEVGCP